MFRFSTIVQQSSCLRGAEVVHVHDDEWGKVVNPPLIVENQLSFLVTRRVNDVIATEKSEMFNEISSGINSCTELSSTTSWP